MARSKRVCIMVAAAFGMAVIAFGAVPAKHVFASTLICGGGVGVIQTNLLPDTHGNDPHTIEADIYETCIQNGDGSYYAKYTLTVVDLSGADHLTNMVASVRVWTCGGFFHDYTGAATFTNGSSSFTTHGNGNPPDWVYYPPGCGSQVDDAGTYVWAANNWYYHPPYVNENSPCTLGCR